MISEDDYKRDTGYEALRKEIKLSKLDKLGAYLQREHHLTFSEMEKYALPSGMVLADEVKKIIEQANPERALDDLLYDYHHKKKKNLLLKR